LNLLFVCFFFQAEDGIRDFHVTGVQTCALPIFQALALGLQGFVGTEADQRDWILPVVTVGRRFLPGGEHHRLIMMGGESHYLWLIGCHELVTLGSRLYRKRIRSSQSSFISSSKSSWISWPSYVPHSVSWKVPSD